MWQLAYVVACFFGKKTSAAPKFPGSQKILIFKNLRKKIEKLKIELKKIKIKKIGRVNVQISIVLC